MYPNLFSPLRVGGIVLKNRLTMAPTYLGYAGPAGTVSPLLLEHYRLMADEWLPDGLQVEESRLFARSLAAGGVAYLSVMGGTYESFYPPHIAEKSRQPGYMADLAAAIRREVAVPVIAAAPESEEDGWNRPMARNGCRVHPEGGPSNDTGQDQAGAIPEA